MTDAKDDPLIKMQSENISLMVRRKSGSVKDGQWRQRLIEIWVERAKQVHFLIHQYNFKHLSGMLLFRSGTNWCCVEQLVEAFRWYKEELNAGLLTQLPPISTSTVTTNTGTGWQRCWRWLGWYQDCVSESLTKIWKTIRCFARQRFPAEV